VLKHLPSKGLYSYGYGYGYYTSYAQEKAWEAILGNKSTARSANGSFDKNRFVQWGAVDLVLDIKSLDPDTMKVELLFTGDPYGGLASMYKPELVTIRTYADGVTDRGPLVTEVLGCDTSDSTPGL
jgi:hypothetical protein